MNKIISCAQNFEDIYLWRTFKILKASAAEASDLNTFILDVGAWEPVADSVSASFISEGWRALLIEPQPSYFKKISDYYSENRNVTVMSCALADEDGTTSLFVPATTTGWASVQQQHAEQMNEPLVEHLVQTLTLDQVHRAVTRNYFVLKLDAEESELKILKGWTNLEISPTCICLEGTSPDVIALIVSRGYSPYFFDGINSYLIKDKYLPILTNFNPINLIDDNGFVLNTGTWLTSEEYKLK